ncbi:LysM peptidoglycan-binding domain-containing protein [Micromonospora zingiberis]|uniref:LysM peptidoglycan-binding domain-containing protein n=1 Tax=Micromonospora zingiberis TaxID=2053011 RepID=A0A4R0GI75_9ACTN|nr:M48 family metalloprotease [Micromonospora zingiberis]TCB96836.1 LysM peptidoglycan-binding domain-containing protein [Micromonospora zingiberis]
MSTGTAVPRPRRRPVRAASAVLGWLRGLLAVGLLAGVYLLAVVLVTVNALLVALVLWGAFTRPANSGVWPLVVGGSIAAAFALVYGVTTVSRVAQPPPAAVFLPRKHAPELWRLVEELARELDTRPPTRIFLTPEVNAAVSEEARMLGFAVGPRTLYLGVPLLAQLTPTHLRAVLCHEFGHYAGRHTRFGAVVYRGAASLESALFRLRMTALTRQGVSGYPWFYQLVFGAYAKVFLWVSLAVRRRQELEADARAAEVVGPAATAAALRGVHALGQAWSGYLTMFVQPVQRLGFVPADLFGAFATMVDDPPVQRRLAELRRHPVEANRSWLDSHPPLARRLASIEAQPAGRPTPAEQPPLPVDRAPVLRVQQKMYALARSRPTELPTDTWVDVAAEAFAVELASQLLAAARSVGMSARPTLGTVLDLLAKGRQDELARRLTDAPEPREQLAEAVFALVGQALAGAGQARWALSWTTGYLLLPVDGTAQGRTDLTDLEALVAAAARDASAVAALRQGLLRRGVRVSEPVPLLLRTVSAPAGSTTGVDIAGRLPDFVLDELRRQDAVRRFTIVVLVVLAGFWGITLIGSDDPLGRPSTASSLPANWPTLLRQTPWVLPPTGPPTDPLSYPGWPYPRSTPLPWPYPEPSYPALEALLLNDVVVVKRGDTLTRIAARHCTTVRHLQKINDMGRRTTIVIGQRLLVPALSGSAAGKCD